LRSLNTRVLFAAGLVLAAFLSAAGLVLDQAFRDSAQTSARERLTGRIYMMLGMIDLDNLENISANSAPLDAAFSAPESGHYAQVIDASNNRAWNSRSMLGITFAGPTDRTIGKFDFADARSSTGEKLFVLSYTVLWEGAGSESRVYTVQVAENGHAFSAQVARFRQSLWLGFFSIGVVLLLVQTVIFRWGLKPLRDVAIEVNQIERGEKGEISGEYPVELRALTENLNALIRSNDSSLQRYRNALGDLAHSLKTPLAVIRASLDRERQLGNGYTRLRESLDQLDSTIDYQLQRAAAAGRSVIGKSLDLEPIIEKIANSLRKVHADRGIAIATEIEPNSRFRGDRGDLMEMVGNIADNACKWARETVTIKVSHCRSDPGDSRKESLLLEVYDDGNGMPEEDIDRALLRGARLDQTTAGHGIGLAVVKELVEEVYNGQLVINSSSSGTVVTMIFDDH
jgi:two-component system sensor histidine kinase PhoQ